MCTQVGNKVGYRIRFDDRTAPHTLITYMTDGILMNHFFYEKTLSSYSVIMLDEAHERSINTDVLLGLLKCILKTRKDLKVIVTSATLNAQKFSSYFNNAPILQVDGRLHPVTTIYSNYNYDTSSYDYVTAAVEKALEIHKHKPTGDILVFLPGQDEIERAYDQLYAKYDAELPHSYELQKQGSLVILACYAALSWEEQMEIFRPSGPKERKVIFATNIAETSLTVNGVVYVVDSGVKKQSEYNPSTGISTLEVVPISKAEAKQRAGRAGRTQPGIVYRLYTQDRYNFSMMETPVPEIQRSPVVDVILQLAVAGITDIENFDFMDPPSRETMQAAMVRLQDLSALDSRRQLTATGRKMAGFPLDPQLSKVLIASAELGCAKEVLTIVAMLSVSNSNFFARSKKQRLAADSQKATFFQTEGDHFMLLHLYDEWLKNRKSASWVSSHYIQQRNMEEAREIRKQLQDLMLK